jgi:UDP-N-acetylmuramyl pentapeptide phosphotransferase/UDP-N-acetylglucosamine-1-phosphate transferase
VGRRSQLRVLAAAGGALATCGARLLVERAPNQETLRRTNFRGRTVSLAGGAALAVGASVAAAAGAGSPPAAAAVLVAGLGAGAVGGYDDLAGDCGGAVSAGAGAKGLRGHLGALRHGRVTTGVVKIAGIGAASLAAAALLRTTSRRRGDLVLDAALIAGTANLVNLLDLRPGRALKAGVLVGVPLAATRGPAGGIAAGTTGAAVALLPSDLGERIMLGDCGANALGALLGTGLAARTGRVARALLVAGVAALTLASERVSFTQVIEGTPALRELDAFGRRRG